MVLKLPALSFEHAWGRGTLPITIVGRILRELIELAERESDAELVDALHDALDVAMPASSNGRCE